MPRRRKSPNTGGSGSDLSTDAPFIMAGGPFGSKSNEEPSSRTLEPPSSGKTASPLKSRRQRNRPSYSPYTTTSPHTPRRSALSPTAKASHLNTPKSPQSPSMRALSAIVSIISPFRSSQAKRSAAFGNPEEDQEAQDESQLSEQDEQDADDVDNSLYPPLPSAPLEAPVLDVTLASDEGQDYEGMVSGSDADGDQASASQSQADAQESQASPYSQQQRHDWYTDQRMAADDHTTFDTTQEPSASDGISASEVFESGATLEISASEVIEPMSPYPGHLQHMDMSPEPETEGHSTTQLPFSPPSLTERHTHFTPLFTEEISQSSRPLDPQLPSADVQSEAASTHEFLDQSSSATPYFKSAFGAPRFSTPHKSGFAAFAETSDESPFQARPPASAFTFGSTSGTSHLPGFPHKSAGRKLSSPLAKNYDLLARFFAEKADAEALGESSSSSQADVSGGLTEIEVAGCVRLIEQSFAQGQGAEVERLRNDALERGRRGASSTLTGENDPDQAWRGRMLSRSPSLPLGAAAGESPVSAEFMMHSRPSTSFLAPSSVRRDEEAINRSLASTFLPTSAPPKRRHRPLYLGPGVGANATSTVLRRSQQIQQRRTALQNHRRIQQAGLQATEAHDEDASGPPKRRKLHDEDTIKHTPAGFLPETRMGNTPKTPAPVQESSSNKRKADESPSSSRSLTADAMLSILSSGPSIPVRKGTSSKETANPAKTQQPLHPEVVNPYEMPTRQSKRLSHAGHSTAAALAAKEKEKLKEERERRQKKMEEDKAAKESTLAFIQRTAPSTKRGRRIRLEDDEDDSDVARSEEKKQQETVQNDRKKKTEEVKRRMDSLSNGATSKAASKDGKETTGPSLPIQEIDGVDAETPKKSPIASPSKAEKKPSEPLSSLAPKPFTFNSAFAPKKPSPLSQAALSTAPDSPSTSSEVSEKEINTRSVASPSTQSTVDFVGAQKVTEKDGLPSTKGASIPQAKIAPTLAGSSLPGKDNRPPARTEGNAISPVDQARQTVPSSLPKFDLALNVVTSNLSEASQDEGARKEARSAPVATLPSFAFNLGKESEKENNPASKETGSIEVKPLTTTKPFSFGAIGSQSKLDPASAATASGFSLSTPSVPSPSTPQTTDTSNETTPQSTSQEETTDKPTSALLSGVGEGEEDEESLHEVRCKMWYLDQGKWNDLGIGSLKVKRNKTTNKRRVLVRNEGNGKVTVNFLLLASFKAKQEKTVVSFLGFDPTGKPTNYRCKIKTEDAAQELKSVLEKEAKEAA